MTSALLVRSSFPDPLVLSAPVISTFFVPLLGIDAVPSASVRLVSL